MSKVISLRDRKELNEMQLIIDKVNRGNELSVEEKLKYYQLQSAVTAPEWVKLVDDDHELAESLEIVHVRTNRRIKILNEIISKQGEAHGIN